MRTAPLIRQGSLISLSLVIDRLIVSGLGDDGEKMKMKRGGNDGDESMYDGEDEDDGDEATLQVRPTTEHGGGT